MIRETGWEKVVVIYDTNRTLTVDWERIQETTFHRGIKVEANISLSG